MHCTSAGLVEGNTNICILFMLECLDTFSTHYMLYISLDKFSDFNLLLMLLQKVVASAHTVSAGLLYALPFYNSELTATE